ncbi:MAG: TrkH family potassium uptake protein [Firmicutes bacterium]|nr:TrkH family potassium uptake protein [Bacillota bacterium]
MGFNLRLILRTTSILLLITGAAMVIPLVTALYFHETAIYASISISMVCSVLLGTAGYILLSDKKKGAAHKKSNLKTRDCYLLVFIAWMACSLLGSLPYYLSDQTTSFLNAFFESVSGYTTTGASVLIDSFLYKGLLMWKALTHWLGGMGILIFMIILLPSLGVGGQRLATTEAPGPDLTKLAPRVQDIAKLLYFVYFSLTVLEFIFLVVTPQMSPFEALINTMGSISTSGLFLHPDGISYYNSAYIEMVLSVFSLLSATNYVLFISLIKRDWENIQKNLEIRIYAIVLAIATLVVTLSLFAAHTYDTFTECIRHGFFQASAFITTTGYVLDDYVHWPDICAMVFLFLLIVGGCGSSTAGGLKMVRFIVVFKLAVRSFKKHIHPNVVAPIKAGGQIISIRATSSITTFAILYLVTALGSALIISLDGQGLEVSLTSALSLMSTTGIYLGSVGAYGSFALFSAPIRLFMAFLMIIGRLEMYTIFFLFMPAFWNPDKAGTRI